MSKRLFSQFYLMILLLLIAACGSEGTPSTKTDLSPTVSRPATAASIQTTGKFQEYPLPQAESDMMRPTIDREGRIWFGEMGHNYLAVFDPRIQKFEQMTPPHGSSGIMGIAAASDGTIWFAEQYANYIGHYDPTTQHYQIYNLPTLKTPDPSNPNNTLTLPSAPNDIALDVHGNVWFTEMNADAVGVLDIKTSLFKHYPISAQKSVQALNPYGITIDPQGMIWFTESSTTHIGRLDPNTGNIRIFTTPSTTTPLMEIASDPHGTIWATSFNSGLLLKFNPIANTFTSYHAPFSGNTVGGLYGIAISPGGEIWVTVSAENVIARLDAATNTFIYYPIPTATSLPIGVVMGPDHTLWFTEASSNKVGMLKP